MLKSKDKDKDWTAIIGYKGQASNSTEVSICSTSSKYMDLNTDLIEGHEEWSNARSLLLHPVSANVQ